MKLMEAVHVLSEFVMLEVVRAVTWVAVLVLPILALAWWIIRRRNGQNTHL